MIMARHQVISGTSQTIIEIKKSTDITAHTKSNGILPHALECYLGFGKRVKHVSLTPNECFIEIETRRGAAHECFNLMKHE